MEMGDIPDSPEIEASIDGLYWIAAHAAAKFEHVDPSMTAGEKVKTNPSQTNRALFTKSMVKGEFQIPSEAWFRACIAMDVEFKKFHGEVGVKKGRGNGVGAFAQKLEKDKRFQQWSKSILYKFSFLRFHMRRRALNNKGIDGKDPLRGSVKKAQLAHRVDLESLL